MKLIFEDIKRSKPEFDFDAAFQSVEKTAESENIPSIASYVSSSFKSNIKPVGGLVKNIQKPEGESSKPSVTSNIKLELIDSIVKIKPSRASSVQIRVRSNIPQLSTTSTKKFNIPSFSIPSILPSRVSRTSPKIKSTVSSGSSVSNTSPRSSSSIGSVGKIKNVANSKIKLLDLPPQPIQPELKIIRGGSLFLFKLDQVKRRKLPSQSKRKFYIAGPADPLRAGVFAPKGVKELRSSSQKIFKQIDINLIKARKNKKAYDPLNSFKISNSGKYVYSSKNLLNSYTKIKI